MEDTIEIEITKEDRLRCGNFTSHTNCLLATAIKRQLKCPVIAGAIDFLLGHNKVHYKFDFDNGIKIINSYDEPAETFKPFTVVAKRI